MIRTDDSAALLARWAGANADKPDLVAKGIAMELRLAARRGAEAEREDNAERLSVP